MKRQLFFFLQLGDKVKSTDEFLIDGAWIAPQRWNVGERVICNHVPVRRAAPAKSTCVTSAPTPRIRDALLAVRWDKSFNHLKERTQEVVKGALDAGVTEVPDA